MINKVNRPNFLTVVPQPKKMENDPGGSQGSGNFYEGSSPSPQKKDDKTEKTHGSGGEEKAFAPELSVVVNTEPMGMTEVVKDLLALKNNEAHVNPGLSVRYTSDSQTAKGLLLNKKAE